MKTVLALLLASTAIASAQAAEPAPDPTPAPQAPACCPAAPAVTAMPTPTPPAAHDDDDDWRRPVGKRFLHGFRIGWMYVYKMKNNTRDDGTMSIATQYNLRSANMFLLGYEAFYRIIGHSWLNVLLVGNVTVAGLEQSKFIPAASGLIGFEFNRDFQLGLGVNVTPDGYAPTHMIAAAGWTPMVGSIQTPVHFFFVPDTDGNHRMGATVGMSW